jgi:DNA-binding transcriptional ArsR family regulator
MAYQDGFYALADPTRRLIFDRLREGPATVTSLAQGLPVSRPAVSQHLKVLKQFGLAADQADGTRRVYRLDWTGVNLLRAYLDGLWDAELARQIEDRRHG